MRKGCCPIQVIKPCEGDKEWNTRLKKFYENLHSDDNEDYDETNNEIEENEDKYEDDSEEDEEREMLHISFHDNTQYELWRFEHYLYYPFYEYRRYLPYGRVTQEQYIADAKVAQQSSRNKNGVDNMWMFKRLSYQRIDVNINYDPFHVLSNIANYIIKLFLGLREISMSTIEFCYMSNMHPELWEIVEVNDNNNDEEHNTNNNNREKKCDKKISKNEKFIDNTEPNNNSNKNKNQNIGSKITRKIKLTRRCPPWQILTTTSGSINTQKVSQSSVIKKIEQYLDAVYLPPKFTNDYELKSFFSYFSQKKGVKRTHFIECSMEFLTFVIKRLWDHNVIDYYPHEYLLYYCMVSSLYSKLLAPVVTHNNRCTKRCIEFRAIAYSVVFNKANCTLICMGLSMYVFLILIVGIHQMKIESSGTLRVARELPQGNVTFDGEM
jgi:hypothetical protein